MTQQTDTDILDIEANYRKDIPSTELEDLKTSLHSISLCTRRISLARHPAGTNKECAATRAPSHCLESAPSMENKHTSSGKLSYQPPNMDTAFCFTRLKPPDPNLDHEQAQPQLRGVYHGSPPLHHGQIHGEDHTQPGIEEADSVQRQQHEDHIQSGQPAQAVAHGGRQCLQQTALHPHQEQVQEEPQQQRGRDQARALQEESTVIGI